MLTWESPKEMIFEMPVRRATPVLSPHPVSARGKGKFKNHESPPRDDRPYRPSHHGHRETLFRALCPYLSQDSVRARLGYRTRLRRTCKLTCPLFQSSSLTSSSLPDRRRRDHAQRT